MGYTNLSFPSGFRIQIRIGSAFFEYLDPDLHFLKFLDPVPNFHFDPDLKSFLLVFLTLVSSVYTRI